MLQPTILTFLTSVLIFCTTACSNEQLNFSENLKHSGSKILLSDNSNDDLESTTVFIYDYNEEILGLSMKPIKLMVSTGDTQRDIISAFLKNNSFLDKKNKVSLLRIEELGNHKTIHLSSIHDLGNQSNQLLFKKALELTVLRHLKNNDFDIVYNETTTQF